MSASTICRAALTAALLVAAGGAVAQNQRPTVPNPGTAPVAPGVVLPRNPDAPGNPATPTPQQELDAAQSTERSSRCSEATSPSEPVPKCTLASPAPAETIPPASPNP